MRYKLPITLTAATAALIGVAPVTAQQQDDPLHDMAMYGISRDSGQLWRYDFNDQALRALGEVRLSDQTPLKGIDAAAHIPQFQNIFAFWNDPADPNAYTQLLYVNAENGQATILGSDLGSGHITGAVAALTTGDEPWLTRITSRQPIAGSISINPNNSPHSEFTLTTASGQIITRDHLKHVDGLSADGTYFTVAATNVRIKPKGNGNQNSLTLGGQVYELNNGTTYLITGDMTVRVYNDHVKHNGKAMGHWWIEFQGGEASVQDGTDPLEDDTSVQAEPHWFVFALQSIESNEETMVDFNINGDTVIPSEDFYAKVTVLGAAIGAGSSNPFAVTTRISIDGQSFEPFGGFNEPMQGNVNDDVDDNNNRTNPQPYVFEQHYNAGTPISVRGRSWDPRGGWREYMTVDASNPQQVMVLRNGDAVPNIQGAYNQNDLATYVRDFVDPNNNTIVLDENQAIFLFELGTTDVNSSAADFQDLVVLVSLAKDKASLDEADDDDGATGAASRLLMVDHQTGGYHRVMTLDRIYDGLAWSSDKVFYATVGNDLYCLDPTDQTETLVGSMSDDRMFGLEFVGSHLMGFENDADLLRGLSSQTGAATGENADTGMANLGTIVFTPLQIDPVVMRDAYD